MRDLIIEQIERRGRVRTGNVGRERSVTIFAITQESGIIKFSKLTTVPLGY